MVPVRPWLHMDLGQVPDNDHLFQYPWFLITCCLGLGEFRCLRQFESQVEVSAMQVEQFSAYSEGCAGWSFTCCRSQGTQAPGTGGWQGNCIRAESLSRLSESAFSEVVSGKEGLVHFSTLY